MELAADIAHICMVGGFLALLGLFLFAKPHFDLGSADLLLLLGFRVLLIRVLLKFICFLDESTMLVTFLSHIELLSAATYIIILRHLIYLFIIVISDDLLSFLLFLFFLSLLLLFCSLASLVLLTFPSLFLFRLSLPLLLFLIIFLSGGAYSYPLAFFHFSSHCSCFGSFYII